MSLCNLGLSCEPVKESDPLCVHGNSIKFPCVLCNHEHRLNLIESKLKSWEEESGLHEPY